MHKTLPTGITNAGRRWITTTCTGIFNSEPTGQSALRRQAFDARTCVSVNAGRGGIRCSIQNSGSRCHTDCLEGPICDLVDLRHHGKASRVPVSGSAAKKVPFEVRAEGAEAGHNAIAAIGLRCRAGLSTGGMRDPEVHLLAVAGVFQKVNEASSRAMRRVSGIVQAGIILPTCCQVATSSGAWVVFPQHRQFVTFDADHRPTSYF